MASLQYASDFDAENPDVTFGCVVVGVDHPLSFGRALHLFKMEHKSPHGYEGLLITSAPVDDYMYIDMSPTLSARRVIELIAHESSHMVDTWFTRAAIVPCTELRAYYLDWLVGKIVECCYPSLGVSDAANPS